MNTIGFNPNHSIGFVNTNRNNQNVNFKGALGDKFVEEIVSGNHVKPERIMEAVKGTFGPKKEKVNDVIESFTSKIAELSYKNSALTERVNDQSEKIADFPFQKEDAVRETTERLEKSFTSIIKDKDKEIAQKDAKIKELEKYESMGKVKSLEDIDVVMPDVAIETFDKMIEKRADSTQSMLNFLTTGKGQEEALKQINRNNIILKAHTEGVTDIKEVKEANKRANDSGIWITSDANFTLNMIGQALKGWKNGSYLNSTPIKNQVKENAMAILTPMADKRYCNTGIKSISKMLDDTVDGAQKFHKNFEQGKEKFLNEVKELGEKGEYTCEEVVVPFSSIQSKFVLTNTKNPDYKWEHSYEDLAIMGEHR